MMFGRKWPWWTFMCPQQPSMWISTGFHDFAVAADFPVRDQKTGSTGSFCESSSRRSWRHESHIAIQTPNLPMSNTLLHTSFHTWHFWDFQRFPPVFILTGGWLVPFRSLVSPLTWFACCATIDILSPANSASRLDRARVVGGLPDVVAIQEGKVSNNKQFIIMVYLKQEDVSFLKSSLLDLF